MNYARAASHAAKLSENLRSHLKSLAEADAFGISLLGDLLAGADELLRWGDCEEALARYYRGAEQAAKVRLAEAHSIRPPYRLESVLGILPAGCRLAEDLRRSRPRNGDILLTAQRAWDVLEAGGDPMAASYFADQKLQHGLQRRNEGMYGHGQEPAEAAQVHAVGDRLRKLLGTYLPAALACWTTALRPHSLVQETISADETLQAQNQTSPRRPDSGVSVPHSPMPNHSPGRHRHVACRADRNGLGSGK
jgi:hypothetical protein